MKTLDELLAEADRLGLALAVEDGKVKARLVGPELPGIEELLRELRPRRDELAARLNLREVPPPPVVVVDRRAAEPDATPASEPEAPSPANQIISSRPFNDAEIRLASGVLPVRVGQQHDPLGQALGLDSHLRIAEYLKGRW